MNRKGVFKKKMILYHAISAYQLFEVMVHRKKYHRNSYAVLLLPDFIVEKYPNWKNIETLGLFDEVHLLNYMLIPHNEETVLGDLEKQYSTSLTYPIEAFSKIYVAGAHFYFSIYLIEKGIPFIAFEDAAGMLEQGKRLRDNLQKTFPMHAKIVEQYELFDLKNEFVKYVICNKHSESTVKKKMFYPDKQFRLLNAKERKKIYRFFNVDVKEINVENAVVLLTQNFVGLGVMSVEKQQELYTRLSRLIKKSSIYIKVHPDDFLDYKKIFENAIFLPQEAPMEVLVSLFRGTPKKIITFSSTASACINNKYDVLNFSEKYGKIYNYEDEYGSLIKILSEIEKQN